jgi:hypothetical protein
MSVLCYLMITAAALVAGCVGPGEPAATDPEAPAPAATPRSQGSALRIEQAERSLDVGRDVPGARAALEEVLADPSITPEQRDEARLGLSRALEARGDREGAIAAMEALLADHPGGARFPLEEAASARLRRLVTGTEADPRRRAEDARPASPFAKVLARYFPAPSASKGAVEVRALIFGGSEEQSERLGTFAIPGALHELRREACTLCDDHLSIQVSSTRSGSWIDIPRNRTRLPGALAVYYFDLGEGRIPARYDAELPLPSAEIAARLSRGDGLVAARERPGAPPVVLIAAPREAQLVEVEEALAAMKTLPTEPVAVPIKAPLRPDEIQTAVRARFGAFRRCYESLLKTSPNATGRVVMHFAIHGNGTVSGVSAEPDASLHDPTFEACMTTATWGLAFPKSGATSNTTVTYPIVFSPGE